MPDHMRLRVPHTLGTRQVSLFLRGLQKVNASCLAATTTSCDTAQDLLG